MPDPNPQAHSPPASDSASRPLAPAPGWRLVRRPHGHVDFVDDAGKVFTDVDVLRAFPVTAPQGPVAIVSADGDELAWLDSLEELSEALQSSLVAELATREFLPLIERIEAISDEDPQVWSVVTDRGQRRFTLASIDDIDRLPDGSAFVVDATGVRYRIAAVAALDPTSLRLLEKTME
jgi:hypothetical protein